MSLPSILSGRVPQFVFSIALALGARALAGERAILIASTNQSGAGYGADNTVYELPSETEAITCFGRGYPGHRVAKRILDRQPSAKLYGVVCADNAAAAAATPCVLSGPVTAAGTLKLQVGDEILEIAVTAAEAIDDIGAAIVVEGTATPDAPVTITYNAGTDTVTITAKQVGTDGNLLRYRWYDLPAGLAITNQTGTVGAGAGATAGTGAPDWSSAYAAAFTAGVTFDFVVPCTNNTTTLTTATTGLRDRIQTMALPANGKPMNMVIAHCTTGSDARTAADSYDLGTNLYTEVGWRCNIIDLPYIYPEPWLCAGVACAVRALATDGTDRNANWPGIWPASVVLPGISPFGVALANYPTKTDWNTDLSNGVSPTAYDYATMTVKLVGSCTCKHVTGGATDYRASWTNHIDVMDGLAVYCTQRVADSFPNKLITNDVGGRPPENLGPNSITPSMVKAVLGDAYEECSAWEWVDTQYQDGVDAKGNPVMKSVKSLFIVERDGTNPSMCNARVAGYVRDWFLGAGIMYEEYGTG